MRAACKLHKGFLVVSLRFKFRCSNRFSFRLHRIASIVTLPQPASVHLNCGGCNLHVPLAPTVATSGYTLSGCRWDPDVSHLAKDHSKSSFTVDLVFAAGAGAPQGHFAYPFHGPILVFLLVN